MNSKALTRTKERDEIIANQRGVYRIEGHMTSRPLCSYAGSSDDASVLFIVLLPLRDVAAATHPDLVEMRTKPIGVRPPYVFARNMHMTNSTYEAHLLSLSHVASNVPESLSNSSDSLRNLLGEALSNPSVIPMRKVLAATVELFAAKIVIWSMLSCTSFYELAHWFASSSTPA